MTEHVVSGKPEELAVIRSQIEMRQDIRDLSNDIKTVVSSQANLNSKFSVFLERDQARSEDIEDLKDTIHNPEEGLEVRLRRAEKSQAVAQESNSVKWYLLGAFILSMVTIGGGFAAWIGWLIRTVPLNP